MSLSLGITALCWIFSFITCAIVTVIIYARWNYGKLDGLGFPVIKPYLIFGSNYMEPYTVQTELSVERSKQYGGVYGAYDGRTPVIYVSDPKIARIIRTVDSDHFRNHAFNWGNDPFIKELLDILEDDKWKTVRSALTPAFTTGKIKQMSRVIKEFGDLYAKDLAITATHGKVEKFEMKEYAATLIIECLAKSFCGIEIPNARDPSNVFIKKTRAAMMDSLDPESWMHSILKMFPILMHVFAIFDYGSEGMEFFITVLKESLESRLDSKVEANDATNILAEMIRKVREKGKEYVSLGISETTVLAQVWEFFLAGYQGMREALVALSFEISKNHEIQEKVYEECMDLDEESGETPYTLACVYEILRLYIAFDKPERKCNRTWTHEGITIPEGTQVVFPISAVHYNPNYFPEPMKFRPERFLDKSTIDTNLFLAFGQGPRACIGSRFAIEIIRILFISFIKKFKIVQRTDTNYVKTFGGLFTIPKEPVYVDLRLR